eukprot:m.68040 g.68040  ORF g.68040 m.68040 type:complete len:389 (-) comp13664_c0_seq2:115-1281(-)
MTSAVLSCCCLLSLLAGFLASAAPLSEITGNHRQAEDRKMENGFPVPRSIPACGPFCRESGLILQMDSWRQMPSTWGPPTLETEDELHALGPFVAPILYGGLGNVLFQLAALHVYAFENNIPCVTGYFQHWNRAYKTFDKWGGHQPPAEGVTLKDTFPSLRWLAVEPHIPPGRVFNRYAFKIKVPDEYAPFPEPEMLPAYIHGYFFSYRYWHHQRQFVLQTLRFNPGIEEYISLVYGDLLSGGPDRRDTVSVHLRLGYDHEPAKGLLADRSLPPDGFYTRIFSREFQPDRTLYLIFSDNNARATSIMHSLASSIAGLKYQIIDENVVYSVAMMARCKHHVLTSSTLSFWGAYLDHKQPLGGRTILHTSFFTDHGRDMVPPHFGWEIFE